MVAVGLVTRLPHFVPPSVKIAAIAALIAIFIVLDYLFIIKEP